MTDEAVVDETTMDLFDLCRLNLLEGKAEDSTVEGKATLKVIEWRRCKLVRKIMEREE